jgi:hypothetical protein
MTCGIFCLYSFDNALVRLAREGGSLLVPEKTLKVYLPPSSTPSPVLCCTVLCCAVLCCAELCCAVLCCAVLCCAEPSRAEMSCAVLCCLSVCAVCLVAARL